MNILIIGATRGIGLQLLEQALMAGHKVTALVRDPQKLKKEDPVSYSNRLDGGESRKNIPCRCGHFILEQLASPGYIKQTPLLTY